VGSFADPAAVRAFAATVDVLTVEVEHVDVATLRSLVSEGVCEVVPSPEAVAVIQDKFGQKRHFAAAGVPLAPFRGPLLSLADVDAAAAELGFPLVLKSRRGAYDGRGNATAVDASALPAALAKLGGLRPGVDGDGALYAEGWAPFERELAVMVVRGRSGELASYPVAQTEHADHICDVVTAPAPGLTESAREEASRVALLAVGSLPGAGVFGVELFLLPGGGVLLNEVAPRPHNSGHFTIDACVTCQYENALRAVLGWPLGDTRLRPGVGASVMLNVLGSDSGAAATAQAHRLLGAALALPCAAAHWYGKACAPRRKVGHITLVGATHGEVTDRLAALRAAAAAGDAVAGAGGGAPEALRATASVVSAFVADQTPQPLVGIIMGSDSDLPCMSAACAVLEQFGVPFEVTVVSAHRTPDRLVSYSREAAARGLRCIVAGAGGAAHLPGMVAALTPLPVVGVPVPLKHLGGMDSLLSIVQMPMGIPVATVAVGAAGNAGLLAVRMLAAGNLGPPGLLAAMEAYQEGLANTVLAKAERLETAGWQRYLSEMAK